MQGDGTYLAFINNGREYTGKNVVEWAKRVEQLGAGQIIITAVDKEGTGNGFDVNLVKIIVKYDFHSYLQVQLSEDRSQTNSLLLTAHSA